MRLSGYAEHVVRECKALGIDTEEDNMAIVWHDSRDEHVEMGTNR